MKKLTLMTLLILMVSCGEIIQESVDKVAEQTSGMLNFSAQFTEEHIAGVWEGEQDHQYAEIFRLYDEANFLQLDSYQRIETVDLEDIKSSSASCNLSSLNESDLDSLETKYYYEFKGDTYQYLANTKVSYLDGSSSQCLLTIGAGKFSILGNYVYLEDIHKSLYIEILDPDVLFMGFSE